LRGINFQIRKQGNPETGHFNSSIHRSVEIGIRIVVQMQISWLRS
jgi:hypothetical protein